MGLIGEWGITPDEPWAYVNNLPNNPLEIRISSIVAIFAPSYTLPEGVTGESEPASTT